MRWLIAFLLLAVALISLASPPVANACPICCFTNCSTFSEELERSDVVAIGKLVSATSGTGQPATATFEIVDILKGKGLAKKLPRRIEVPGFTAASGNGRYLLLGAGTQPLAWGPAYPASTRLAPYLREVLRLPKQGSQRLTFYFRYLEDADEMIARDAYDELVRVDYAELKRLRPVLNHDQLVAWISDDQIPTSRRRLYFTMLGICGSAHDVPVLERLMRSGRRADTRGLESLIACYLTLRGTTGLPVVEELYLANIAAEYDEFYCAILAIRFHLKDESKIARPKLIASLRLVLSRPELADLVIPDLAKAEDWAVIDRLMLLYRDAPPKETWVRVPVINYLQACPLPRAKEYLDECERLDPKSFQRAHRFDPVNSPS